MIYDNVVQDVTFIDKNTQVLLIFPQNVPSSIHNLEQTTLTPVWIVWFVLSVKRATKEIKLFQDNVKFFFSKETKQNLSDRVKLCSQ